MTEDKTYTATVNVVANSQYAEFQLNADVAYAKFDQGWEMTNCTWTENAYQLVRYPDEDDMTKIINASEELTEANLIPQTCSEMATDLEQITYTGDFSQTVNAHVSRSGEIVSQWNYEKDTDTWRFVDRQENLEYTLTDIEGEWESEAARMSRMDGVISISNYTGSGFDTRSSMYHTDTVHVTYQGLDESGSYLVYTGGKTDYSFQGGGKGYSGTNASVRVQIGINEPDRVIILWEVGNNIWDFTTIK